MTSKSRKKAEIQRHVPIYIVRCVIEDSALLLTNSIWFFILFKVESHNCPPFKASNLFHMYAPASVQISSLASFHDY